VTGLYRSIDGGFSFDKIMSAQPRWIWVDPVDSATVYYTYPEGIAVCRSANRGLLFTCDSIGAGSGGGVDLFIDPKITAIVYAAIRNRQEGTSLLRSTNKGVSWSPVAGTVRPTLLRPEAPIQIQVGEGLMRTEMYGVRTVESNSWSFPFTVESSEPWLTLNLTQGEAPQTIGITADASGLSNGLHTAKVTVSSTETFNESIEIPVQLIVGNVNPPALPQDGVSSAAFKSQMLSEGGLFSAYGGNLALGEEVAGEIWPTSMQGATVTFNGIPAPLYYVHPGQINGQVPHGVGLGPATVEIQLNGVASAPAGVEIIPAAPGILPFNGNRAVAVNEDGQVNTDSTPAAPGSFITVYMIGIGPVDNPVGTGEVTPDEPFSRATAPFSAIIGGEPAYVDFLGLTPRFIGLAQANIQIPDLAPGTYELVITVNGVASNALLITVGAP
jgi:uncharacterized protein (TIGR03437 family)